LVTKQVEATVICRGNGTQPALCSSSGHFASKWYHRPHSSGVVG